jgi:uroporphyrinogen III methyltransferase/synthase
MSESFLDLDSSIFCEQQEETAGPARAFLVGAGPGDPGLITRRGAEILGIADVVLYDRLVADSILQLCRPEAELICVQTLEGTHPQRWPEICRILVQKSLKHRVVVRLKGGDCFLFGRGAEECEALLAENISYEVVPGVSSGLGAPAWAGIPVTHREMASSVAFVTAHELGSRETRMDWGAITSFPGTLVFFMPLIQIQNLKDRLISKGMDPNTPAAFIERGTRPDQRVITTTVGGLVESSRELESPTLVVVGQVVNKRKDLAWAEKRPLAGLKILLTRPAHQAASTVAQFQRLGALVENQPLVKVGANPNPEALQQAICNLDQTDWIVFSSTNGVRSFWQALKNSGKDSRSLGRCKVACIGPSTANSLLTFGIRADLVPSEYSSEGVVSELGKYCSGKKVLLVRANRGRDLMGKELGKLADVVQVAAYSHEDIISLPESRITQLDNGFWDWVVLGSSTIAQQWFDLTSQVNSTKLPKIATISPVTAGVVESNGKKPEAIAKEYHFAGIAKAIAAAIKE